MKKVLFVATVVKAHIMVFHLPYLEWFKKNGYEVHVCASNDYENKEDCKIPFCEKYYDLPFERSPFKLGNVKVYKELKEIIDAEDYDVIHCHTPMGGVLGRLAAREARKKNTKTIYTAHGFHFYKGAPLLNWLVYYSVERWMARYTDVLITINKEDYLRAKKSFKAGEIEYIPGVGIDIRRFTDVEVDQSTKRPELGIPSDAFIILSIGELNKNKNHTTIIRAIQKLANPQIHYLVCGQGALESQIRNLIEELKMEKQVHLVGFRTDIPEICKISDIFAFPSKREGLGLGAIEAMASGLPIITSNIHGILDYSVDGVTGYTYNSADVDGFAEGIGKLYRDPETREIMGIHNKNVAHRFRVENVKERMEIIYKSLEENHLRGNLK